MYTFQGGEICLAPKMRAMAVTTPWGGLYARGAESSNRTIPSGRVQQRRGGSGEGCASIHLFNIHLCYLLPHQFNRYVACRCDFFLKSCSKLTDEVAVRARQSMDRIIDVYYEFAPLGPLLNPYAAVSRNGSEGIAFLPINSLCLFCM